MLTVPQEEQQNARRTTTRTLTPEAEAVALAPSMSSVYLHLLILTCTFQTWLSEFEDSLFCYVKLQVQRLESKMNLQGLIINYWVYFSWWEYTDIVSFSESYWMPHMEATDSVDL